MPLLDWQRQMGDVFLKPGGFEQPPGSELSAIEKSRLAIYDELLFNTVLETMDSVYPHCRRLLGDDGGQLKPWRQLVEAYRRACPNRDYKLMGAVRHFPAFVSKQSDLLVSFPFLVDLARYEWLEMKILNAPDQELSREMCLALPENKELDRWQPVWNTVSVLETLRYNIPAILEVMKETIDAETLRRIPLQSTDVLIYREPETAEVRFFCLNVWTSKLLRQPDGLSFHGILERLHAEPALQAVPFEALRAQACPMFEQLLEKRILLGARPL